MARLIDADVLLGKLSRMIDYCREHPKVNGLAALFEVGDAIMDCKTVDAVEVVRCKDCKYYRSGKHFTDINFCQSLPYYAEKGGLNTSDDDFCSLGERKEK